MFLPRSVQRRSKEEASTGDSKESEALTVARPVGEETVKNETTEKGSEVSGEGLVVTETTEKEKEMEEEGSESEEEPVLSYSKLQRWPQPGEPVCVVCGRYGAYIVDRTDRDVCSLECKARHLVKLGIPLYPCTGVEGSPHTGTSGGGGGGGVESGGWSYREHPEVSCLTAEQVCALRRKMTIKVVGETVPKPISNMSHLSLPQKVLSNLEEQGYTVLTPVQMQVIPAALYQRDLLVCAATGSGKTLSFLLPILLHLMRGGVAGRADSAHQRERLPRCLVLTPTRELAMQIEEQAKLLMRGIPEMKTCLVIGGVPIANQLHRLRSGVELVVATPARLNDIIENHPEDIELADVEIFVLDEVDCLLSMGFEAQVREVVELLPVGRQCLMFSATVPPSIARLARSMMRDPISVTVGEPGTPCEDIRHTVLWVEETAKKKKLLALLSDNRHFNPPVVIFVTSRKGCLLLADTINKTDIAAATAVGLHGDMAQERRGEILREFLEGRHSVLVATNVLGRGIDLICVSQVFIFDMPSSLPDFIHQVGRAGRVGSLGTAITFINSTSKSLFLSFAELMRRLGVALPPQLTTSPYLALQREQRSKAKQPSAPLRGKRTAVSSEPWGRGKKQAKVQ